MDWSWRNAGPLEREEFYTWVDGQLRARNEEGRKKWGDTFIGSPLDKGIEEVWDLLFYLFYVQRELRNLREELSLSKLENLSR